MFIIPCYKGLQYFCTNKFPNFLFEGKSRDYECNVIAFRCQPGRGLIVPDRIHMVGKVRPDG